MADDEIKSLMSTPEFRRGDESAVQRFESLAKARWGTQEINTDTAAAGPETPLSPELQQLKARYEQGNTAQQQQAGQPVQFSPEWDLTQEQADEALRREWGFWHPENMVEIQNPENFRAVFGDFIRTDQDKQFLGELFQLIGNHPSALRLYLHLTKLTKRQS